MEEMEFFRTFWKDRPVFKPCQAPRQVNIEIRRTDLSGLKHLNIGHSLDREAELRRFFRKRPSCGLENRPEATPKQTARALWGKWNCKPVAETVTLEDDEDFQDPEVDEPPSKKSKMNSSNGASITSGIEDVEIVKVVSGNDSLKQLWPSFPSKQSLFRLGFSTTNHKPRRSTVFQEEQNEERRKYSDLLKSHVYPKVCGPWVRSRPFGKMNYITPSKFDRVKEALKCQTEKANKAPEVIDIDVSKKSTPTTTRVLVNRRHSAEPVTEATPKAEVTNDIPKSRTPFRFCVPDVEFVRPEFIQEMKQKHLEQQRSFKEEEQTLLKSADLLGKINKAAEKQRTEKVLEDIGKQFKSYLEISESVIEESEDEVEIIPALPELTDEMQREIDTALARGKNPNEVLVDAFNVKIHRRDILTLSGLNWLNDEVINFYMNLLMERGKSEKYPSVYAFNTFFYPKLVSGGHSVLKRWTKKVDIFSYDFLVAPVHLGVHWCMVVMDLNKKTVMYFDSMGGRNDQCLTALRQYLCDERMDKKKEKLDTSDWNFVCMKDIPQQMNGSDCGMFSCMYAEYTCRRAAITFNQQDMPYFRRKMIYEILKVKLLC